MRHYEMMIILDPNIEERTIQPSLEGFLEVVTSNGGTVDKLDIWGKRPLPYPIDKQPEGIYAIVDLTAEPATVQELDRQLNLNESVLRTKILRPERPVSQSVLYSRAFGAGDTYWPQSLPVTIYLADESIHDQVEAAVDELLAAVDGHIEERDRPIFGSWFRSMRAGFKQTVHSPAGRDVALTAAHVADSHLILAQDAHVTATLLQNLGPVITSLQPTKDALLRIGALLIVKVDWEVRVFQLTAAQQAILDHQPQLAFSPHEIISTLQLISSQGESLPSSGSEN